MEKVKCVKCDRYCKEFLELECFHCYCLPCTKKYINIKKKSLFCYYCKKTCIFEKKIFKELMKFNNSIKHIWSKKDFDKRFSKNENLNLKNRLIGSKFKKKKKKNDNKNLGSKNSNLDILKIELNSSNNLLKDNNLEEIIISSKTLSKDNSNINLKKEILSFYLKNNKKLEDILLWENNIKKNLILNKCQINKFFNHIINKLRLFEKDKEKEFDIIFNQSIKKVKNIKNIFKKNLNEYDIILKKIDNTNDFIPNKLNIQNLNYLISNDEENLISNFQNDFNFEIKEKINSLSNFETKLDEWINNNNSNNNLEILKLTLFDLNNKYLLNKENRIKTNTQINSSIDWNKIFLKRKEKKNRKIFSSNNLTSRRLNLKNSLNQNKKKLIFDNKIKKYFIKKELFSIE